MKKILLSLLGIICSISLYAASIAEDYTFIAQTAMNGSGVNSGTNYDLYVKSLSGSNHGYATNKGSSTINGTSYLNCMQIKGGRGIKFSVSSPCKVIIYGQEHSSRYYTLGTTPDGTEIYTCTVATSVNEIEITDANVGKDLYLSANSDLYLAGLEFVFPKANQTQYSAPIIAQGEYNKIDCTYAVTLLVDNDEDGTINYTIGDGEKVTNVASGTIVSVPYSTAITATVSGSSFEESEITSFTTSAMAKTAPPVYALEDYNFLNGLYTVSLTAAGDKITYTIDGGAETDYSAPFTAAPGAKVVAYATETNMSQSANLSFTVVVAPSDGSHTIPTDGSVKWTDGMIYNAGSYTITNDPKYIGGNISSGSSSLNGSIKMRISRAADPVDFGSNNGFHLDVNSGYTITSVKLQILNNYDTDVYLTGVYVDSETTTNLLAEPVALQYASANTVKAAVAEVKGIAAKERVVFVFGCNDGESNPNQAQVVISVTYAVPVLADVNTTVGYGTLYYEKELAIPADTKAYTGELVGNSLVLTELTDVIPAKTAVIVSGNGGLFEVSNTGATFDGTNDLKGTASDLAVSEVAGGTVCVLGYENSTAAFYKYSGATLAANKAYLVVPESASAKGVNIVFDTPTAVDGVEVVDTDSSSKAAYNFAGQQVNANAKGLVIVGGKKFFNK